MSEHLASQLIAHGEQVRHEERERILAGLDDAVDALFVNAFGERAARLVLTDAMGRDLGGWCKKAIVDRLRERIEATP